MKMKKLTPLVKKTATKLMPKKPSPAGKGSNWDKMPTPAKSGKK